MKKVWLTIGFICILAGDIRAEIIQVDSSTWTQDQKNMTAAMSYQLLYKAGITYKDVLVKLPDIEVTNPSKSISAVLTKSAIETEYQAWKIISAAADLEGKKKQDERNLEIESSIFKNSPVIQLEDEITKINNLSDTQTFLKQLIRYFNAKGYLDN